VKKQITALIAEDMRDYHEVITHSLNEIAPDIKIVGKSTTLAETAAFIEKLSPNIVFLDIAFEEEERTSFDLLQNLKEKNRLNFHIVFITAHTESRYYARAFEYKAIHFIEKPIDHLKLAEAIKRIRTIEESQSEISPLNNLAREIGILTGLRLNNKIIINGLNFDEVYDQNDIQWIEADGRYSVYHLANGKKVMSSKNLGEIEKEITGFPNFFRIQRSEIINLNHVERISKKQKIVILSGTPSNHYVSKDRFDAFLARLKGVASV
jgi:two-component system, LytTR family, response regulator